MPLAIQVLGDLTVLRDGKQVALPPSKKTRALLAYLVLTDRPQRRERLCEMFWEIPDDPRGALRWSLSKIRQILGGGEPPLLIADRNVIGLDNTLIDLDIAPLRRLSAKDLEEMETERLEYLASLSRGLFLDDLSLPRCPEFEAWRTAIANEIEVTRLQLLRLLIDRLTGEPARALPHAHALLALQPDSQNLRAEIGILADAARRTAVMKTLQQEDGPQVEPPIAQKRPKPTAAHHIRHCTTPDGVRLAYALSGDGLPIIRAAHWMSHLELDWESPIWHHWIAALSAQNTFIRYDQRGNGLSDRDVSDVSFEAMISDLESIVDAAGFRRTFLLGISQGCALSIAYAARHPERVAGLILYGGFSKGWRKRDDPREYAKREAMGALMREGWGQKDPVFRQMFTSLFVPEATPDQMEWFNELQRNTVSAEMAHAIYDASSNIDVENLLAKVQVPTLVMHGTRDAVIPFEHGEAMATKISGARFVALDSANHVLLADEPAFATFVEETRRFVADPEGTQKLVDPLPAKGIKRFRQHVTVLSAEIVSPVHAFESSDPEAETGELQPIYDCLLEAIEAHDGVVTASLDGTVTAAFGLTRATEDHAYLACRAALAARQAVDVQSRKTAGLRAGIDTGELIVRHETLDEKGGVELTGAAPRAASRLMRALRGATIAVTARARAAAGGYVQMQLMGSGDHPQLGRDERVFELIGESEALSRWHLRVNRGLTHLVAREAEMKTLQACWRRVREGHGQIVGIVGDAGLGKSRLVHEFAASDEVSGFTVLETGGLEFDARTALGVVKKLLLSACAINPGDELEIAKARLAARHAELQLPPQLLTPLFFLADMPVEDQDWLQLGAREKTMRVSDALRGFLIALSRRCPLSILFEDLHWLDRQSELVLNRLVESLAGNRILLLATYRPHHKHDWHRRSYFQQIRLERFVKEEAQEFLTKLLGPDPGLDELRDQLAERAQGTPLYLEEMVRALAEKGDLEGIPGAYRPTCRVVNVSIPATVQSLVAARIQQLGKAERQVLQVAAVIGRNVPAPLLSALAPVTSSELVEALTRLQDLEFLFAVQSLPHSEYTFKHAVTHAVTYETMLKEDCKRLHRDILTAMEVLYSGSLTHHVETLSEHALRAEEWDAASRYAMQAAARAEERSSYRTAARFLEDARRAVAALPRTQEALARAVDTAIRMRPVCVALGEYHRAAGPLSEARQFAEELGDQDRLFEVLLHQSYLNSSHGRYEDAIEPAETMRQSALVTGTPRCVGEADLAAAQALLLRSESRKALARLLPHREAFVKEWRERFGQMGTRSVWYLGHLSHAQARLGMFDQAEASLAEAGDLVREVSRPVDTSAVVYFAGLVDVLRGSTKDRIAKLRDYADSGGLGSELSLRAWILTVLGHAEFGLGDSAAASVVLEEAIGEAERLDLPQYECHARALLACARTRLGEPEAAANLDHALTLARGRQDPWSEILALRGLSESRPPREAVGWLEQACDVARRYEFKPELARSMRALGLAQRWAKIAGADAIIAAADELYAEMDLRGEEQPRASGISHIPGRDDAVPGDRADGLVSGLR